MASLQSYLPQAEQVAGVIDEMMLDELHLMAPAAYELNARGERVYLVASYNSLLMGRSLRVYEHPDIARRLKMALNLPVTITKQTGTRYVVLLSGALKLPKVVQFPDGYLERDVFRLGVGLKGEVCLTARQLRNVLIGAAQGMGKSNILELLVYQMITFGWDVFLGDPQSHTFNPDAWNEIASMSVAGSHADMVHVLNKLEDELASRVMQFRRAAREGRVAADIDQYNEWEAERRLPRLGLVVDEANFFLANKGIFNRMAELLRQGRKFGLQIVLAAHEWHKDSVPAAVNDLIQTRIALSSLSGAVVLRSNHWGKWAEGRPPGRGVLKTNHFEPMQFYLMGEKRSAFSGERSAVSVQSASPISEREAELVRRSLAEAEGKMSVELLVQWGMSQEEAREMAGRYESRGWLRKDVKRRNARFVTEELAALVEDSSTNSQTAQTDQTAEKLAQTDHKLVQTPRHPPALAPGASVRPGQV